MNKGVINVDNMKLINVLSTSEEALMENILFYAKERGYAKYTSTLKEAWRLSIVGLSASIIKV